MPPKVRLVREEVFQWMTAAEIRARYALDDEGLRQLFGSLDPSKVTVVHGVTLYFLKVMLALHSVMFR